MNSKKTKKNSRKISHNVASLRKEVAQLRRKLHKKEKKEEIDDIVNRFVDYYTRSDPRKVLPGCLQEIGGEMNCDRVFFAYENPKRLDGQESGQTIVLSKKDEEAEGEDKTLKALLEQKINQYKTDEIAILHTEANPLKEKYQNQNLLAVPIFGGRNKDYLGTIGIISRRKQGDLEQKMLEQAASRLDNYMREKILQAVRHRIMRSSNYHIKKQGFEGVYNALRHIVKFSGAEKATIIYYEEPLDQKVLPKKRKFSMISVGKNGFIDESAAHKNLTEKDGLGGKLIVHDRKQINSEEVLFDLGIMEEKISGKQRHKYKKHYCCHDITDEKDRQVGKFFLISNDDIRGGDADLMEAIGFLLDHKFEKYLAVKNALSFLHPDIRDMYAGKREKEIIEWFFNSPRKETIAMMYCDVAGFSKISSRLEAQEIFDFIGRWANKGKKIMRKYGILPDKLVGDCLVSLAGPPFCGVSASDMAKARSKAGVRNLVERKRENYHEYAYHSVLYALEMQQEIKNYRFGGEEVGISFGIVLGEVAIGSPTGDLNDFTALGDNMNLGQRFQTYAGKSRIAVNEECVKFLKKYAREVLEEGKLPFEIAEDPAGEQMFKGQPKPMKAYFITPNKYTARAIKDFKPLAN